MQSIEVI